MLRCVQLTRDSCVVRCFNRRWDGRLWIRAAASTSRGGSS